MSFSNISPMACPAHQQVRQQLAIASSCSLASRPQCFPNSWEPDRSGPVHEHVQFPVLNRAYIFLTPPNQPVSLVYRSVFFCRGNRCGGGLGPARPSLQNACRSSPGVPAGFLHSSSQPIDPNTERASEEELSYLPRQCHFFITVKKNINLLDIPSVSEACLFRSFSCTAVSVLTHSAKQNCCRFFNYRRLHTPRQQCH
jgi:hypothetical protein